jgi:hypothetical protein
MIHDVKTSLFVIHDVKRLIAQPRSTLDEPAAVATYPGGLYAA